MNTFEFGDKVKHKSNDDYNTHLMDVMDTDESKVLCSYFDRFENAIKEKWFNETELDIVSKPEGGFVNG